MSYTKKLRKQALREGVVPGKALEASIQQTLAERRRLGVIHASVRGVRDYRSEIRRQMWEADRQTFVCRLLLSVGFQHALPCYDYPEEIARQLLPADRRRVAATPAATSATRSYITGRSRQYSADGVPWRRIIAAPVAVLSPTRLYVRVDMPGGFMSRVLRAPRGWHWEMRSSSKLNEIAAMLMHRHCGCATVAILQSDVQAKKHAIVTAGAVMASAESDVAVVAKLRQQASSCYDIMRHNARVHRQRLKEAVVSRMQAARKKRTCVTVDIVVFIAGVRTIIRYQRRKGIASGRVLQYEHLFGGYV